MGTETAAVRRGRKFDQVLEGAREVFLRDGFEGANVDDIARAAGVSKATLYSYFPDKRLLFMEMATRQCQRQADEALMTAPEAPVGPEAARIGVVRALSASAARTGLSCRPNGPEAEGVPSAWP